MSKPNDVFEQNKNICSDQCWTQYRDWRNKEIDEYTHYNNNFVGCHKNEVRMPEFYLNHVNLRGRPGYGVSDPCLINTDSMLRNNPQGIMRDRCNIPLHTRVFTACPSLLRGSGDPSKELQILSGSDSDHELPSTSCKKNIMEMTTYHTVPLLKCVEGIQDPTHIIPPWTWGGDDTRSYRNRLKQLEKC